MSFWDLEGENGKTAYEQAEEKNGNAETSNNLPPIPKGTCVRALISNIKWDQSDSENDVDGRYINAEWTILAPAQYAKRKIFHKIKVNTNDPKKSTEQNRNARNRHLSMLGAINFNCGSRLPTDREPTDADLFQSLLNNPMIIKLETWEDRETKEPAGNWVSAVSADSATGKLKVSADAPAQNRPATSQVNTNQRRPQGNATAENNGQHPRRNPNAEQQQGQGQGFNQQNQQQDDNHYDPDQFDDDVPF